MNRFLSNAVVACYDGEPAPGAAPATPPVIAGYVDQAKVNSLLAEERRRATSQTAARAERAEKLLADLQSSASLSPDEKGELLTRLEESQAASRTREEQQLADRKESEAKLTKKAKEFEGAAKEWEERYRGKVLDHALAEAAADPEIYNSQLVQSVLKPMMRLEEVTDPKTGKPTGDVRAVVDFPDTDPTTQEPIVAKHTPRSATKRMKDLPAIYGGLFKSGVVSGVGSGSGSGTPTGSRPLDVRKLSQEQYMQIRATHPEQLGLRPKKR
jgi:hypothetical protein